jgi:hypothetical protein
MASPAACAAAFWAQIFHKDRVIAVGDSSGRGRQIKMASSHDHSEAVVSYFVGLDVSLDETAICVVDDTGTIQREGKTATQPEAITTWLQGAGNTEVVDYSRWMRAILLQWEQRPKINPAAPPSYGRTRTICVWPTSPLCRSQSSKATK